MVVTKAPLTKGKGHSVGLREVGQSAMLNVTEYQLTLASQDRRVSLKAIEWKVIENIEKCYI